jgi:acid stress-induced BolA-like protein IbaG/YrbA
MMFGNASEHFANLRHVNRWKTRVSGLNPLFRGTEVVRHPFNSVGTKIMIGSVSKHFANLRHVKRRKACVSGMKALFRGTMVVKHPLYSIGTKMMFWSVSEHFANLRHVKKWKTYVRAWMHYFEVPKLWSIHSSQLDLKWCLGVFQSISLTFGT